MRPGWSDTLQSLATKGVPTYLFSSGYGDVVTQVLLQGMGSVTSGGAGASARYVIYLIFGCSVISSCVLFFLFRYCYDRVHFSFSVLIIVFLSHQQRPWCGSAIAAEPARDFQLFPCGPRWHRASLQPACRA